MKIRYDHAKSCLITQKSGVNWLKSGMIKRDLTKIRRDLTSVRHDQAKIEQFLLFYVILDPLSGQIELSPWQACGSDDNLILYSGSGNDLLVRRSLQWERKKIKEHLYLK